MKDTEQTLQPPRFKYFGEHKDSEGITTVGLFPLGDKTFYIINKETADGGEMRYISEENALRALTDFDFILTNAGREFLESHTLRGAAAQWNLPILTKMK